MSCTECSAKQARRRGYYPDSEQRGCPQVFALRQVGCDCSAKISIGRLPQGADHMEWRAPAIGNGDAEARLSLYAMPPIRWNEERIPHADIGDQRSKVACGTGETVAIFEVNVAHEDCTDLR